MKKILSGRKSLIVVAVLVALAVALTLCGCQNGAAKLTNDTALYWNVDKGADRTAAGDGTYTIKVIKDGEAAELKVADKATMDAIDAVSIFGVKLNDAGAAAGILSVEDLGYKVVANELYVQMIGGKVVKLNTSASYGGDESTINVLRSTKVLDMTGCAGDIGTASNLQKADKIIALEKDETIAYVFVCGRDGLIKNVTKHCEACGKEVTWSNWFYDSILPEETGHYYLEKDVTVTDTTISGGKICLDLNGKTIKMTTEKKNIFTVSGALNVLDTVGTGKILPSSWPSDGWTSDSVDGRSWGQAFNLLSGTTLTLYGGTVDGSAITAQYGVCININAGGEFIMKGGKIIGGTSWGSGSAAILVQGNMTMEGGEIIGGNVPEGAKGNARGGGAMRITASGVFIMNGGSITGGTTVAYGGALNVAGQCKITGGTVSGGSAGKGGDNVYVYKTGKLVLGDGVSITGIAYE